MTEYRTAIELGKKYTDERTGISGWAEHVEFMENGCIEVYLEFMNDKNERKQEWFSEHRLVPEGAPADFIHTSDIVLGREYIDPRTNVRGTATTIMFSEKMATRVNIRYGGTDKDGLPVVKFLQLDDFHLTDLETKQQAKREDPPKRSPVEREVTPR